MFFVGAHEVADRCLSLILGCGKDDELGRPRFSSARCANHES